MQSSSRLALCQSKQRLASYQAGPKTKNRMPHQSSGRGVSRPVLVYYDEILGCHWLGQCWLSFHTGEASGTHRGSAFTRGPWNGPRVRL